MRFFFVIFSTVLLLACGANQNINASKKEITHKKTAKDFRKKANPANAIKNKKGSLIGFVNKASFTDTTYKSWFNIRYKQYNTDKEVIAKIKKEINNYTIKGFMGTWCGDSKREVPRFFKILEETGFNKDYFELIAVARDKKTPKKLTKSFNLIRVPTFIFLKNGKEIGRFVEKPRETIEKDILKIVTEQGYKHSYDTTK